MGHAERAAEVIAKNKELASKPGKGWHEFEVGENGGLRSPQSQGLPSIADHVVVFADGSDHTFAGPCADKVSATLKTWMAKPHTDQERFVVAAVKEALAANPAAGTFVVDSRDWNAVLTALSEEKLGVTQTSL